VVYMAGFPLHPDALVDAVERVADVPARGGLSSVQEWLLGSSTVRPSA
jgi:hypothetical protein